MIEHLSGVCEALVSLPAQGRWGETWKPGAESATGRLPWGASRREAALETALGFLMIFNWVKASLNPETEKVSKRSRKSDVQMVTAGQRFYLLQGS